jgi:hypothetical protein
MKYPTTCWALGVVHFGYSMSLEAVDETRFHMTV